MIEQLSIKNFKSIKDLKIHSKKLNVFIGEPNSGKSNIIEALALQSQNSIGDELSKDILRYKSIGDLFYDTNINTPIEVTTNEMQSTLFYAIRENRAPENKFHFILDLKITQQVNHPTVIEHDGKISNHGTQATRMFIIMNSNA